MTRRRKGLPDERTPLERELDRIWGQAILNTAATVLVLVIVAVLFIWIVTQ